MRDSVATGSNGRRALLEPMPMTVQRRVTRRNVVRAIAATTASLAAPYIAHAQSKARFVVVGGGFGGASCARALKRLEPQLEVTLIEPNSRFFACPFSNEVIAGLRDPEAQEFSYQKIGGAGVIVVPQPAVAIDPQRRTVTLGDASTIGYQRLVLSPGIDLRFDALPGYDEAAATKMPHAWKTGEQTRLLRRQLQAMEDGGVVALAIPANPSRCPPAPYERASLIAHYLKTQKPRSKVLILDAKDSFSQQRLFEEAWTGLYGGMIERIPLSQGGSVTSVDPATNTIMTEFGDYTVQVANVIPPQKAGRIAELAGAADHTGWCPIDPTSFASKLVPNIHIIGDACLAGTLPKSASAAVSQAQACAAAIVNLISGKAPNPPKLTGVCYNTVAPGYAFSLAGTYVPRGDVFMDLEAGGGSPLGASSEIRRRQAEEAKRWFSKITADTFE
jgi:sulfide dehydrogenase [flavocytochrome c] flavoprotein chain